MLSALKWIIIIIVAIIFNKKEVLTHPGWAEAVKLWHVLHYIVNPSQHYCNVSGTASI